MISEVIDALGVHAGGRYCDATVGGAGHARAILQRCAPEGQLIGFDRDPAALRHSAEALKDFKDQVTLFHGNFAQVVESLAELGLSPVDGFLLDLGVSSHQFDTPERGFSFSADGPLDMRMDPTQGPTAAELLASLSERELSRIIWRYGEEPASRKIARSIKQAVGRGELEGTRDLQRVVAKVLPARAPRGKKKIHPATRTFMALRMAVNDELGALERFLATFTEALKPGGRVVVITFHSLEDRAVKHGLVRLANPCVCPPGLPICGCGLKPQVKVLTRRPLKASSEEIDANPRCRSAKVRAAERLA